MRRKKNLKSTQIFKKHCWRIMIYYDSGVSVSNKDISISLFFRLFLKLFLIEISIPYLFKSSWTELIRTEKDDNPILSSRSWTRLSGQADVWHEIYFIRSDKWQVFAVFRIRFNLIRLGILGSVSIWYGSVSSDTFRG